MDRRGISAIVATVLVILITVAGVSIIWVGILPMIRDSFVFQDLDGRVSVVGGGGYTLYDAGREIAMVQVRREPDEGVMNRIVVSFIVDGNSVSSSVVAPPSGGTKVYNFDLSGYGAPESVEVAPIFASGSREKVGAVTSKVGISSGTIGEVRGAVYEIGLDYVYEVPTDGLISFWTFSGDVLDGWGENDGIVFGEGDELVGGELVLDGNDYVNIGDPVDGSLDFGVQSFSVGVWMKGEIPVDDKSYILGNFYPGYAFHIRKDTNNIRFVTYTHSGATSYVQANINSVLDGEWHYLLGVRDVLSDTLRIYLDGSLLSSVADNSLNIDTARPFEMGRGNDAGGTYYFSGQIDNVMVFNKVLLEEEVIAIYGAQRKS